MDKQVSEYCTGCGLCACQHKAVLRKDEKGFCILNLETKNG